METGRTNTKKTYLYRYKVITTIFFFYAWLNLGVTHCVLSSTLPDFRNRLGITNEEFGRMGLVVTIFTTTGGFICGMWGDRLDKNGLLFVAIIQLATAISHVLIPWSVNIYMAAVLFIIRDTSYRSTNALGSSYVIAMWGKTASFWVHFLHAGYPVGCVLGPIISGPFLSKRGECEVTSKTNYVGMTDADSLQGNTSHSNNVDIPSPLTSTRDDCVISADTIEWPYAIGSASWIISAILFLLLYFGVIRRPSDFRLYREPIRSFREAFNPSTCSPRRPSFGITMIAIFFLYYACLACIGGIITNTFLFTYAVEGPFNFSNQEADYLDIALKASMLLARFLILPIAYFVPIHKLLVGELFLLFLCSVLLSTLGTSKPVYLWLFSCCFNFLLAPLWPAGLSWFDRYVTLYTLIIVASDIFTNISVAMTMWLVGYILDSNKQNLMWTLNAAMTFVLLFAVCIGQSITWCYGERHFKKTPLADANDDVAAAQPMRGNETDSSEHFESEDEIEF